MVALSAAQVGAKALKKAIELDSQHDDMSALDKGDSQGSGSMDGGGSLGSAQSGRSTPTNILGFQPLGQAGAVPPFKSTDAERRRSGE